MHLITSTESENTQCLPFLSGTVCNFLDIFLIIFFNAALSVTTNFKDLWSPSSFHTR